MSGADKTKLDNSGVLTSTPPADVTKAAAAVGVSGEAARQDHKHDVSTAITGAVQIGDAAAEGSASSLARSDHTHSVAAPGAPAVPVAVGSVNSEGVATSLARSDHVHAVGVGAADAGTMIWGNSGLTATTTTRYLTPGYTDSIAKTTAIQIRAPRAGTLQNFYMRHTAGGGNGNNIVYTIRKNGVATALTITMASTANDGSDLANTVSVAKGDLLDIEVTKAAGIAGSPTDVVGTVEFL
jgi:hypothetical protein